jgi:DNA-binding NarL/FixJ family response regulator
MLAGDPGPPQAPVPGLGRLSAWDRELGTLVARGRTDAEIAAELFISVHTVSSRLGRIRDKTGCRHGTDLTRLALAAAVVQPDHPSWRARPGSTAPRRTSRSACLRQ